MSRGQTKTMGYVDKCLCTASHYCLFHIHDIAFGSYVIFSSLHQWSEYFSFGGLYKYFGGFYDHNMILMILQWCKMLILSNYDKFLGFLSLNHLLTSFQLTNEWIYHNYEWLWKHLLSDHLCFSNIYHNFDTSADFSLVRTTVLQPATLTAIKEFC